MMAATLARRSLGFAAGSLVVLLCICGLAGADGAASQGASRAPAAAPAARAWAFAAFADNRGADERPAGTFEGVLAEIRDRTAGGAGAQREGAGHEDAARSAFPPIDFAVGCGDIKMAADRHRNWDLWQDAFKKEANPPCLFPVIGNWDDEDVAFNKQVILPAQRNAVGTDPHAYYVDWRNVRLIVAKDAKYVEKCITTAPPAIEHVFVADHYPVFARFAHQGPPSAEESTFWSMLVRHRDKVRAYLCGHTHHYSRLRVADPSGRAADGKTMADEPGGVWQIDCGNAGRASHGDAAATLVEVRVDGRVVDVRVVQAAHGKPTAFRVIDEWRIAGPGAGEDGAGKR